MKFFTVSIIFLLFVFKVVQAEENINIEIPENMYRSAVAIGFVQHNLNTKTGQIEAAKVLLGTGILINDGRHFIVVTARHVILDDGGKLIPDLIFWSNTKDGDEFRRSFEYNRNVWKNIRWVYHNKADIAAIIVGIDKEKEDVFFISLNDFIDINDLEKGQGVYYLGFPRGLGADSGVDPVLRHGIVALIKPPNYFYMDATAAGGNSGGPVFRIVNSKYYFVGTVTDFPPSYATGLNFYYHTGLSRVFSTNVIKELINSPEFETTR